MTASEFALLQRTSVVTLSIAGIFKEVVTISVAGLVFGDALTPINISGLVVTIGAIAAYNWIKITKMREEALKKIMLAHVGEEEEAEDDEQEDWNTMEGTYVTADGDIAPIPGSAKKKKRSNEGSKDLDSEGVEGERLLGGNGGSSSQPGR
jgi:solute carrier family 35 protein C2